MVVGERPKLTGTEVTGSSPRGMGPSCDSSLNDPS